MLGLPKTTEFNKRIPKQKFYENLSVTPAVKKAITEQIKTIYWRNKLAATTSNLAPGERVTEIEVFEVRLTSPDLDENVLRLIDREIPYHILFLLEHDGKYQAAMGYKEAVGSGKTAFRVDCYYRTEWPPEEGLPLCLEGLTIDAVYENLIRQIAGEKLSVVENMTLKESVARQKQREKLGKQIAALETRMKKEKQLNRKMELKVQIKKLQSGLEEN